MKIHKIIKFTLKCLFQRILIPIKTCHAFSQGQSINGCINMESHNYLMITIIISLRVDKQHDAIFLLYNNDLCLYIFWNYVFLWSRATFWYYSDILFFQENMFLYTIKTSWCIYFLYWFGISLYTIMWFWIIIKIHILKSHLYIILSKYYVVTLLYYKVMLIVYHDTNVYWLIMAIKQRATFRTALLYFVVLLYKDEWEVYNKTIFVYGSHLFILAYHLCILFLHITLS